MLGIVPELISATAVVGGLVIAFRNRSTDLPDDAQVIWRARVDVRHGRGVVAVSCPEYSIGSHQYSIGSATVGRGRTAAARQRASHAGHAADVQIVLRIENIDTKVGSVGDVSPLCSRIDPLRPSRPRSRALTVRGIARVRTNTRIRRFVFIASPPNRIRSPTFDLQPK